MNCAISLIEIPNKFSLCFSNFISQQRLHLTHQRLHIDYLMITLGWTDKITNAVNQINRSCGVAFDIIHGRMNGIQR